MCEEVQVSVAVTSPVRPGDWHPQDPVAFRFGGGLFSVDDLRKDLLGKPRYFFTTISLEDKVPIHRTSYGWFLGTEYNPETEELVTEALGKCSGA
jgi:hypothetical protein